MKRKAPGNMPGAIRLKQNAIILRLISSFDLDDHRLVMHGRHDLLQPVCRGHAQGFRAAGGHHAHVRRVEQVLVDDELHAVVRIEDESEVGDAAGLGIHGVHQFFRGCELQARAADCVADFLRHKLLVRMDHQQVELAFFVFEKDVADDLDVQRPADFFVLGHGEFQAVGEPGVFCSGALQKFKYFIFCFCAVPAGRKAGAEVVFRVDFHRMSFLYCVRQNQCFF